VQHAAFCDLRGVSTVNSLRKFEFERVALIHGERLLRFAMKFCVDRSGAEDLVQETLLSAWSNFSPV